MSRTLAWKVVASSYTTCSSVKPKSDGEDMIQRTLMIVRRGSVFKKVSPCDISTSQQGKEKIPLGNTEGFERNHSNAVFFQSGSINKTYTHHGSTHSKYTIQGIQTDVNIGTCLNRLVQYTRSAIMLNTVLMNGGILALSSSVRHQAGWKHPTSETLVRSSARRFQVLAPPQKLGRRYPCRLKRWSVIITKI